MSGGSLFNRSVDDDFDTEFDTRPEPEAASAEVSPSSVDELVDEVTEEEEELDEEMSEAERRISLAGYYKLLAKGGVFNDGSDEAKLVDQELKAFARERVIVLLNLPGQQKKVELPFTEQQVEALVSMANRLIERQGFQPAPAAVPAVRPLAAPVAPVATKPVKPAGPQVKALAPPVGARKPAPAPAKKKVAAKAAPVVVEKPKQKIVHTIDNTPLNVIFEENGKQYKFVNHPDGGEPLKLNVSASRRQVRPPGAIPMPSEHSMVNLSAQLATMDVNSNSAMKSQVLMTAAALSAANREE